MKDRLIYKESNQSIVTDSPMSEVLENRQLLQYFGEEYVAFNSGNRRGYSCEWAIVESELYLTKFRSRSIKVHKIAQIFGMEPIHATSEKNVQNMDSFSYEDTTQVKADWFNGIMITYDRIAKNEEDINGWEYTFENGKLVEEKRKYVFVPGQNTAKKLQKYIEN